MTRRMKDTICTVCIGIAVILALVGVGFLLKAKMDEERHCEVIRDTVEEVDDYIAQNKGEEAKPVIMLVDKDAYEVPGEEYDFGYEESSEQTYITGIGILEIPCINSKLTIMEGTSNTDLRYGVGHYTPSAPLGGMGNCTILGHHMKAYGSIFNRLSEVDAGDTVKVTDIYGNQYVYEVDDTRIVHPSYLMEYLETGDTDTARITLITCAYTSEGKQRLVVTGHMI